MRISILLLLFSLTFPAYSCDCTNLLGYNDVDWVVTGKILKIEQIRDTAIISKIKLWDEPKLFKATVAVHKVLKGEIKTNTVEIYSHSENMADCGFPFEEGDVYKIFADNHNGYMYTDLCYDNAIIK